jgi:hypothetical protein
MSTFALEAIGGQAVPFQPQIGFGEYELAVNLKFLDLRAVQPVMLTPVRARVDAIMASGDDRLPIGGDDVAFTHSRLEQVRTTADEAGSVTGVIYAFVADDLGVVLDGLHRAVVASERGQEFLDGFAPVTEPVVPTDSDD